MSDNFFELKSSEYDQLQPGDYIRWKNNEGELVPGAMIKAVWTAKNGRRSWRVKGGHNYKYTIYWDTIDSVLVRKPIYYIKLEDNIKSMANIIEFIIVGAGLQQAYSTYKTDIINRGKKKLEKK